MNDSNQNKNKEGYLNEKEYLGNEQTTQVQDDNPINSKKEPVKQPWLAAFFNIFFPGLGHFYGKNYKKSGLIFLGFLVTALSFRYIAFNIYLFVFLLIIFIGYYLFQIFDAYLILKRKSPVKPLAHDKWWVYVIFLFVTGYFTDEIPRKSRKSFDRITILNIYSIPTPSMIPTLQPNDILITKRTKNIQRNDITIFKYPKDKNTRYIMRCIGTPGDEVKLIKNKAYVNGKFIDKKNELAYSHIIFSDKKIAPMVFRRNDINHFNFYRKNIYQAYLTPQKANNFSRLGFVDSVKRYNSHKKRDINLFPDSDVFQWNYQNFGPLTIPAKGQTIPINNKNRALYAHVIKYENKNCSISDSLVKINGEKINNYTFKNNYYFVLGDSRDNSLDSRFWGFVPENYLLGKPLYFVWSDDFDRIGKNIQ